MAWIFADVVFWKDLVVSILSTGCLGAAAKAILSIRNVEIRHNRELADQAEKLLNLQKNHCDALVAGSADREMLNDQVQYLTLALGDAELSLEHLIVEFRKLTGSEPPPPPLYGTKEAKQLLSKSALGRLTASSDDIKTGGNIFLVDDNEQVRSLVAKWLKQHGYEVFTAASVVEARSRIDEYGRLFNLILLDLMLPDETNGNGGVVIAEHVKNRGLNVPIVVVTALDEFESRKYIRKIGAVACVVKPYEISRLMASIRDHIRVA